MSIAFTYKKGLKDGIPIALGYFAVSFAFGVTVVGQGLPALTAIFMSMTNLTSAGQFAGATVIIALGTFLEIILTQAVINARYFLMGITLSQRLDDKFTLLDRFLCAFGITDEIFAVAVSYKKPVTKQYLYGLILLPFIGWSCGTALGALAGNVLPSIITTSLTIALYAMFVAIVIPACMQDKKIAIVALIAVILSCAFYYLPFLKTIPSGISYIVCALIASVVGAIFFPFKEEKEVEIDE
jgi:4-azaleucine resistance transporter AzlC